MILTNEHKIPEIIVRAMGESYPMQPGRVAVTALIDAPLIRYLKIKYWNDLREDASQRLWALLGTAAHHIIQKGRSHTDKVEEYLKIYVNGMAVTGRSDILIGDELVDLKVTSVFSFLLGEKDAWVKQLNVYNYMFALNNIKIKSAAIWGIARDWQEMKQYTNADYPPIPFVVMPIELWDLNNTRVYIEERVKMHQLADECLRLETQPAQSIACTDADRWVRPTTYAVKKGSNKRAERVLDSFSEAQQWMIDNGKTGKEFSIEERKGSAVRCERFCVCRDVCPIIKAETV
jgi:hypothetical protein